MATATDKRKTCLPTTLKTSMLSVHHRDLVSMAIITVTSLVHQDIPAGGTVTLVITDIAGTQLPSRCA
ncbi:hypothetical protein [Shewanella japonica]|uniref:hypothetical protein n=1 Tax=Shewanella japonica TaxID=93973 RepID=UPI0012DD3460|nr:hypothetical protein [Shewanella japonica]